MKPIRHELTVRVLKGVLPLMALASIIVYVAVREVLYYEFDSALKQEARILEAVTERVGTGIDFDYRPGTDPAAASDFGQDYRFELTLSDGSLLKRSDDRQRAPLALPSGALGEAVIGPIRLPNGHRARGCALIFEPKVVDPAAHLEPVDRPDAPPGPVRLVIAASTRDLDRLLAALATTEVLVGVMLVFATVFTLRRSVREGLAPVEVLATEVTAINPMTLTARVNVRQQPSELRPIAGRINELLERLEDAFDREKRFTANAAHELRTPIAEIRTIAEVAADSPSTEDRQRGFAEIVRVSQEMQEMISNLLAMARARSGTLQVDSRNIDVSSLLLDWCGKHDAIAAPGTPPIRRHVDPGVWVDTDPVVLGAVVNNLLDNAASYTTRGEDIEVRLCREGGGLRITVENSCEPLNHEDVRGMFEPFWRKRGTTVNGNHSGLGLALVRSLCDAIRVSVSAELLSPQRIAVSVRIPG